MSTSGLLFDIAGGSDLGFDRAVRPLVSNSSPAEPANWNSSPRLLLLQTILTA